MRTSLPPCCSSALQSLRTVGTRFADAHTQQFFGSAVNGQQIACIFRRGRWTRAMDSPPTGQAQNSISTLARADFERPVKGSTRENATSKCAKADLDNQVKKVLQAA